MKFTLEVDEEIVECHAPHGHIDCRNGSHRKSIYADVEVRILEMIGLIQKSNTLSLFCNYTLLIILQICVCFGFKIVAWFYNLILFEYVVGIRDVGMTWSEAVALPGYFITVG